MKDKYNPPSKNTSANRRLQLAKAVERDLCQRYAITPYHARVIAQLQSFGERDV